MVGVNDNYRARSHELFEKEFRRVLNRAMRFARSPDRTVVVSIPDWGAAPFAEGRDRKLIAGEVDGFNGRARPLVERACARWVDVTEASRGMLTDPSLVAPDGLHPSGEMYRRWAEIIAREAIAALGGD
jgi:lysophospholipase L1-like esterase